MNDIGELELDKFDELLNENTKLVFVNHVSNALGTINPISEIISKAHKYGAKVLIDGAQASAHFKIDLQNLDVDYYVTSAQIMWTYWGRNVIRKKRVVRNASTLSRRR